MENPNRSRFVVCNPSQSSPIVTILLLFSLFLPLYCFSTGVSYYFKVSFNCKQCQSISKLSVALVSKRVKCETVQSKMSSANRSVVSFPYERFCTRIRGAGLAQWWERSPPTNVSRVRFPDLASYVVGSLLCSERFFSGYSGFPLFSKTNISKFQFDLDYCQALYHEPLALWLRWLCKHSLCLMLNLYLQLYK